MSLTFFKRHKLETTIFILLAALYFFLRLYHIMSLPMFTDEAIYTRWTQIAKQDSAQRFISLTDGKEPLFTWINALCMFVVPEPLLSGRLVSVVAGFFSMLGLFFLGKEIYKNKWVGFMAALLYIIYPFSLVYDRMALYDSLVSTFSIWQLYCAILLVKKINLRNALQLGIVLGTGMLNKTDSIFTLYFLPLTLTLFDYGQKDKKKAFMRWLLFAAIASVIGYGFYSLLRISPSFYMIKEKNAVFIYPFSEWIHHPFTFFIGNMHGLFSWFVEYLTWPLVIAIAAAFVIRIKSFWREKIMLLLLFLAPLIGFALFFRVLYPRYMLFITLPLLLLASYTFIWVSHIIKNKLLFTLCFFIVVFLMLRSDYFILTNFAYAPIPQADTNQFVNDWPAGGGLKEAISFFKQQAKTQKIYIATEGTFGLLPFGLEAYLINDKKISIHGFFWEIKANAPPPAVIAASKTMPTYFVFYEPCSVCPRSGDAPPAWPLKLIARYKKGIGKVYLSIYQVLP